MNGNDNHPVAKPVNESYDENAMTRLTRMESRISVVEVDMATIRSICASKEDLHAVREDLHAVREDMHVLQITLLEAIRRQGVELRAVIDARTDMLVERIQRVEIALLEQRTELLDLIHRQRVEILDIVQQQRVDTLNIIHQQRKEIVEAFDTQRADTLKYLVGQAWRLYTFAAVLLGAVYFIARNIH